MRFHWATSFPIVSSRLAPARCVLLRHRSGGSARIKSDTQAQVQADSNPEKEGNQHYFQDN